MNLFIRFLVSFAVLFVVGTQVSAQEVAYAIGTNLYRGVKNATIGVYLQDPASVTGGYTLAKKQVVYDPSMGNIDDYFKQAFRSLELNPRAGTEQGNALVFIETDSALNYYGDSYPFKLDGSSVPESALEFKWQYSPTSFPRSTATGYEFRGRKGNKVGVFNTATGENSIGGGCIQPVVLSALEQRGLLVFPLELSAPNQWDEATLTIFEGDRTETVNQDGIRLSVSDPAPSWIQPPAPAKPLRLASVRRIDGKITEVTVDGPSGSVVSLLWRPTIDTKWMPLGYPVQTRLLSEEGVSTFYHETIELTGFYQVVATPEVAVEKR